MGGIKTELRNSLYWFTLTPRATSSSQKPLGNSLSNQNRLHTKPPKKWPLTLLETHFLWHNTHQKCCSWQPQEHTPLIGNNTRIYKVFKNELHLFTEQSEINTDVILFHSLLRKSKAEMWMFRTWYNWKLKSDSLVCYKT